MPLRHHSAANTSASVADIVYILHLIPLIHSRHGGGQAGEKLRSVPMLTGAGLGLTGRLIVKTIHFGYWTNRGSANASRLFLTARLRYGLPPLTLDSGCAARSTIDPSALNSKFA